MKKGIFICILTLSTQVFAQFPIANIEKFSGNYRDPSGSATASDFLFDNIDFGQNPTFSVERQAGLINLRTNAQEFTWENPPAMINDLSDLNWDSITLNSTPESFSLEIPSFNGSSVDANFSTTNLSLKCDHAGTNLGDLTSELLDACLNNSSEFYTSYISFSNNKGTSLSGLGLYVNKNYLNFNVKVGVNVKGNGQIWYDHSKKQIKIRIDRAKAGFINVRGKLFDELRALESEKIRVNEPWVEIDL